MPANSTHPDYDANLAAWLRARDVIAGEEVNYRHGNLRGLVAATQAEMPPPAKAVETKGTV